MQNIMIRETENISYKILKFNISIELIFFYIKFYPYLIAKISNKFIKLYYPFHLNNNVNSLKTKI